MLEITKSRKSKHKHFLQRITLNIFDVTLFRALALATLLSFMAFTPVSAQDWNKGVDAYQAGDYATALQEWRPLADQGDADAQYFLGVMYEKGNGVPQNYAEAVKWFRLAADQGDADAQYNLGVMYEKGYGVPQNYAEAVKWFRLSAKQGDAQAQYNLGIMYRNGEGVPKDYADAVKWFRLSAKQGDAQAQNSLAVRYEYGEGVLQNNIMAHMWYNLAAANGHEKAGEWRDERAGLMTNADISKAQAMARECMSSGYTKCGY